MGYDKKTVKLKMPTYHDDVGWTSVNWGGMVAYNGMAYSNQLVLKWHSLHKSLLLLIGVFYKLGDRINFGE